MENRESVDQRRSAVRRFLKQHAELLRAQGAVVESWRERRGRRSGPYYRLAYREGGRQRSIYLGADRELAEEVRRELGRLQALKQQRRRLSGPKTILRRELARQQALLGEELLKIGLYRKGREVRGWRGHRPD